MDLFKEVLCDSFKAELVDTIDTPDRTIVRVSTEFWNDKRGLHTRKNINYLRTKSTGYNILEENVNAIGAYNTITRIINLYEVKDGIYEVMTVNEEKDRASGYIKHYEFKLIPYTI